VKFSSEAAREASSSSMSAAMIVRNTSSLDQLIDDVLGDTAATVLHSYEHLTHPESWQST
jgi:hypothetical protein